MNDIIIWFIGDVLPYITILVFIAVLIYNFIKWLLLPRPIVWSLFPSKHSTLSILLTIAGRIFALPGPRKVDKLVFGLAWIFHIGLIVSLSLHAKYIFIPSIPAEYYLGSIAGIAAAIGTIGFIIHRIDIDRTKVNSSFADYFALALLLTAVSLGAYLRIYGVMDHEAVWMWIQSILSLKPIPPPSNPVFLTHILIAQIYMIYLPFKTLIHPIAMFYGQKVMLDGRHLHER